MTTANEGSSKPNFLDLKLNFKGRVERYAQLVISKFQHAIYCWVFLVVDAREHVHRVVSWILITVKSGLDVSAGCSCS